VHIAQDRCAILHLSRQQNAHYEQFLDADSKQEFHTYLDKPSFEDKDHMHLALVHDMDFLFE
jgi:hypothetical protein